MLQLQSAIGVFALLAIAWGLGENRRAVSVRQAAIGLVVTVATALVLIKLPVVARAFGAINDAVETISAASRAGTSFVFGYVGGAPAPFDVKAPGADFILAFQALPIVLVMSVLTTRTPRTAGSRFSGRTISSRSRTGSPEQRPDPRCGGGRLRLGCRMAKQADGFELKFTHRGSWMVDRIAAGRPIDVIPVAWARDFRIDRETGRKYQRVNYQDPDEMEARLVDSAPLVFALAEAKDYGVIPHSVKSFQGVYEGRVTGRTFGERSLEVEVLRRLKA
jgi:hypothetical protein